MQDTTFLTFLAHVVVVFIFTLGFLEEAHYRPNPEVQCPWNWHKARSIRP